jgi:hypothetical protein
MSTDFTFQEVADTNLAVKTIQNRRISDAMALEKG